MNNYDKQTAEKLRALTMQNATVIGGFLLGFSEALRLRDYEERRSNQQTANKIKHVVAKPQ